MDFDIYLVAIEIKFATCMFINKKENVILVGGSGTGKTHLAISLAVKALSKEYSVYFTTVSDSNLKRTSTWSPSFFKEGSIERVVVLCIS